MKQKRTTITTEEYLRREFSYSKFEQALILPEDVVKEKISANASNGVLTIDLPKRTPEEKAKVNRINRNSLITDFEYLQFRQFYKVHL